MFDRKERASVTLILSHSLYIKQDVYVKESLKLKGNI